MSLDDLDWTDPNLTVRPALSAPRKCQRHLWDGGKCARCDTLQDVARIRRNRNNRTRGNRAELDVAREVRGRKVGPLGHPWDVEMAGYARLQVKKLLSPPSLRYIAAELAKIAAAPGEEMPGFVWIEPGRDGEQLITFRLKNFAERHGIPEL